MKIIFDTIQGASASIDNQLAELTRTGIIDEIDGKATSDSYMLIRGLLAAFNEAQKGYPGKGDTVLRRLLISPTGTTNRVRFTATFVRPSAGLVTNDSTTVWMVESKTTTQIETEEIDRNGRPVLTRFYATKGPGYMGSSTTKGGFTINTSIAGPALHTAELPVRRSRRVIQISGYMFGQPDKDIEDAQDCVNVKYWSGKPAGFWLCTSVDSIPENAYPIGGNVKRTLYRVRATFETKKVRDWSHYAVHRNLAGKIPAEMLGDGFSAKIKALVYDPKKFPYTTDQNTSINGVVKVGMYDLADFEEAFDFNMDKF